MLQRRQPEEQHDRDEEPERDGQQARGRGARRSTEYGHGDADGRRGEQAAAQELEGRLADDHRGRRPSGVEQQLEVPAA